MSTLVALPDEALLGSVVELVWDSMLHQPALPWLAPWQPGRTGVHAEITVTGDCDYVVELWCADSASVSMTRSMLALNGGADPDLLDVEDAIGEVLNVVSGTLKGALGGTSSLSLPRVAERPSRDLAIGPVQLTLSWHDDPVLISVLPSHTKRTEPRP